MEVDTAGPRRLTALIGALPPESATHRSAGFPPTVELLATLVEQHDKWALSQLQGSLGAKRVKTPGVMRIRRPGQPDPAKPHIETDPRAIAAWFRKLA